MVSYEDILIRIRGQDNTGGAFKSAQSRAGAMKTAVGGAVTAMSASMLGYAKSAMDAAMTSEQEWMKFGNAVTNTGGNWDKQSAEIKSWVREYSNSMGRSVADTRAAMTTYMNMGMSLNESQDAMKATSNYAAQMGMTQEAAAGQLQKAFMGNGRALKALGLDIKNYKDETTGAVDKQKLLNDILSRTGGAADKYAETTTAKFQRLNNTLAGLKTDFGAALMDAISPLIPVVQGFLNVINSVPGPLKTVGFAAIALGAGIGVIAGPLTSVIGLMEMMGVTVPTISGAMGMLASALGITEAEMTAMAITEAGLTAEEVGAAAAHASNGVAIAAEGAAATAGSVGFWSLAAAELAALWPILLIAAAVAAVIVAIEQIGEALGWWTDFGTMLDAIKAGVMRLWEAFINSPQVQGTLAAIQGAFQALWGALQPIFQWLTDAWNNLFKSDGAGSGGPDVVGQLINLFGTLGGIAGDVVNTIVRFGTEVYTALSPIVGLVSSIISTFSQMLSGQISIEQGVMMILANIRQIFTVINGLVARIGQRILQGIVNALRPIPARITQFLMQAALRLLAIGGTMAAYARQAGLRVLNGIITHIRQIPARVGAFMRQIPGRISSAAGAAVSAAMNLANSAKDAVVQGFQGMADTVYQEFVNIGSRINESVSSAVSAAANFGSAIKDAVLNALHIASPGIIQRKIAIEFQDIPGRIGESNDAVYSAARDYGGNILRGFNAPQMNMGALREQSVYTPTNNHSNVTIVHVHKGAVPVDARNMTQREAQGVVTLALESLGNIPAGGK